MAGERGQGNPQPSSHPRMAAGLPSGPGQEGLGESLRQAASSMGEVAGEARERVGNLASEVGGRLEEAWESARSGVRRGAEAVVEGAESFWTGSQRLIRQYPIAAVAIAFFVGCLTPACLRATFGLGTDDVAEGMSRASYGRG